MSEKVIKVGIVGVGDQGSSHLDIMLGMPGVLVKALCDTDDGYLYRARKWVEEAGQPSPKLYGQHKNAYQRLCSEEDLDLVICTTPWEHHSKICLEAMKNNKNAVCEVPIVLTLEEAWQIVETYESTGYWATLGFKPIHSPLLNMIRLGLLGDVLYAEGGYIHDLRLVKFDPEREPWRLQHSIDRNGNLYPDHPATWAIPLLDINHGDRFDYLVSMSSRAQSLNEYAAHYYGESNYYATKEMKQGDYNATLIRTVKGKVFNLTFDTNTPHPRSIYRLQGTRGTYLRSMEFGNKIYLDGRSQTNEKWEDAAAYEKEYEHPLMKAYKPDERAVIRGHSGGSNKTPYFAYRLIKALREGHVTDFDVYDSVTSSVISALTEESVANGSVPVTFPDFTRGKWEKRKSFQEL
ncbi:MAG: Gfo/Idh/MocA family oxidoreductase [Bacillota bacterium]|nr:Gfo/Idh/MocA family oxidoreductase [Bacillota bacterium]